jgi:hypothetical protein
MMDAMATVHPDWARRDDQPPSADLHAPHVEVDNLVLGADGGLAGRAARVTDSAQTWSRLAYRTFVRSAYAGQGRPTEWARYPRTLEHDIIAAPRDVDRTRDDEPTPVETNVYPRQALFFDDRASRHFPHMTPANHRNQRDATNTSAQVSAEVG